MKISWSSSDHLNADVVDDASGQVLFHLDTPYKLFKKQITTMTDAQGQVVGEYEPRLGHDRVTYKGETHRVSDWLPTNGFFFSTYVTQLPYPRSRASPITDADGRRSPQLVDAQSEAVVARTHAPNLGIRSARHNIIIEAGPEIVPFLDLIVLSFVICETERCARRRQNVAASQVSAANAVAVVAS